MKTVVAFGTFDIIHPGHISYLQFARTLGDRLIVVVTPDKTVVRRKGVKSLFNERERLEIVGALGCVSSAVLGDKDDSWNIIVGLEPDVVCFGYDQKGAVTAFKQDALGRCKKNPPIITAPAYRRKRYHSTQLKLLV